MDFGRRLRGLDGGGRPEGFIPIHPCSGLPRIARMYMWCGYTFPLFTARKISSLSTLEFLSSGNRCVN